MSHDPTWGYVTEFRSLDISGKSKMFLNLQQPQPSMNLNSNGNKYDFILAVLTYAESHDFLPHTLGFEHIHTFDYE